jgi:2-amino-4-hydroxy-6-hydroxymethyldihydropteridine diphosphokinase
MICAAIHDLGVIFGKLIVSPVYETPAEGFDGDDFYNLVIGLQTELPFASLHAGLRAIEASNGRVRGAEKFSSRTLDIDVLTYGDAVGHFSGKCIPNREILEYGYVLRPLADVAPDELHPELAVSYRALWKQFPGSETDLRPIPLDCG